MSTKPKKAQTKAQTKAKERFATGAKRTPRYLRSAMDAAIERGERLEKIVEIIDKWRASSEVEGYGVVKQIYKLAKGS